jgi:hypothetical protein
MPTLATQLRNAVLSVLIDNGGPLNMSDEDYSFLNLVSTYGQSREGGGVIASDTLAKVAADNFLKNKPATDLGATGPDMKRADPPMPVAAPLSPVKGAPATLDTVQPPDTTEQQEALPLGTADRGPEPQDAETLVTQQPEIDPSDPPPDYTRLETAAARQV